MTSTPLCGFGGGSCSAANRIRLHDPTKPTTDTQLATSCLPLMPCFESKACESQEMTPAGPRPSTFAISWPHVCICIYIYTRTTQIHIDIWSIERERGRGREGERERERPRERCIYVLLPVFMNAHFFYSLCVCVCQTALGYGWH